MTDLEEIKREYFDKMQELLRATPEALQHFEALWTAGKFREAYVFVSNYIDKYKLFRSPENKLADENFFWGFMY